MRLRADRTTTVYLELSILARRALRSRGTYTVKIRSYAIDGEGTRTKARIRRISLR